MEAFEKDINNEQLTTANPESIPAINCYCMIHWTLKGLSVGDGYGFPFDRPHLNVAKRIEQLNRTLQQIKGIHLRGNWQDNKPYHKLSNALKPIMKDSKLWEAVAAIEKKSSTFDQLRTAMRIAMPAGSDALNDEGEKEQMKTIEKRVKKFRKKIMGRPGYASNTSDQKMIQQIDKYWEKLFADPIITQTPGGPVSIQPQRTNNILEQFFRQIKRSHRRRTGNASSSRMLRTILAETPLVRNLKNPAYMKIILDGKATLQERFAAIDIETVRKEFRDAKKNPERIPAKLKPLIALSNLPGKLVQMIEKAVA